MIYHMSLLPISGIERGEQGLERSPADEFPLMMRIPPLNALNGLGLESLSEAFHIM